MILLVSCATAPKKADFINNQTYNLSYDKVWESVVSFFATNGLDLKTIDKNSGLLVAEKSWQDNSYSDCGSAGMIGVRVPGSLSKFNVLIEKISPKSTKVTVNQFAKSLTKVTSVNPYFGSSDVVGDCFSTGKLEKMIFESIK